MVKPDDLRIEAVSEFPNYGKVAFLIRIINGTAVTKFSDAKFARDIYRLEKQAGNKNVTYQERLGVVIEKYPGKTKEFIAEKIVKELKKHNAEIKKGGKKDEKKDV
tara:strand:+ start:767 stop:1084 length:318 start_codon:yes stop_codon:yes gene_type:complete